MNARRTAAFAALGLAAATVLGGCTTGTDEPDAASGDTEVEEPADEGLTTDLGGECLVGDWIITEEEMQGFYSQLAAENGFDIVVSGSTSLDFTADRYEYVPDFTIEMTVSGQEATGSATGSVQGDYSVADGVITTENDVAAIVMPITVNGVEMDASDIGNGVISSHPINSVTYHCEAGAPVIDFITSSSTHPVALTAG